MFGNYTCSILRLKHSRSSQGHAYAKVVSPRHKGLFILKTYSPIGVWHSMLALQRAHQSWAKYNFQCQISAWRRLRLPIAPGNATPYSLCLWFHANAKGPYSGSSYSRINIDFHCKHTASNLLGHLQRGATDRVHKTVNSLGFARAWTCGDLPFANANSNSCGSLFKADVFKTIASSKTSRTSVYGFSSFVARFPATKLSPPLVRSLNDVLKKRWSQETKLRYK